MQVKPVIKGRSESQPLLALTFANHHARDQKKTAPFVRPVAEAACQTWRDLCAARWTLLGVWIAYWILIGAIVTAAAFIIMPLIPGAYAMLKVPVCLPDGFFSEHQVSYNWWTMSGLLDTTIPFGPFDSADVKVIYIAWQLVGLSFSP